MSHNLYQDFNVAQPGVILNNATGQLTQTHLGCLVQNNPHLTGQAANIIINEVVGANPSQLQGYLEVAGQQAGVVVANPNGLTCDGCGFVNTPNVTLSTGKPVLDARGQLQMLDVKQGTLTVGGKGLDASRQASIDLVARAVQLNGALHGKEVNVIAGANRVNRQTGEISAQQWEGAVPEVAIDTAAMGGMYAGKIRLVSTEAGVGVNLANVVASQGDLMLDASGNVSLVSQGDMTLKGSDIQAGETLSLDTDGMLKLLTATDDHFYRKDEKKSGVMVKMSGNGTNSTAERQNQLDGADINISAGQGVLLQVGQKEGESLQVRLDTLATQPGMAWVEQVRSMPGVKMDAVQEAYEQWNYSQQSLSPVASSIIAIALAVATMGGGVAALAAVQGVSVSAVGATSAAMANAAFSTLVSQATISTINNGGNLGAVLKELGSSASVKQLATSVATAGALQGLDKAMGWTSAAPAASNAASQRPPICSPGIPSTG